MLMKLLANDEKVHLVALASLLALADKPLLWDGRTYDEITSSTKLKALSIREGDLESELITDLEIAAGIKSAGNRNLSSVWNNNPGAEVRDDVYELLVKELKKYPILRVEQVESRVQAASSVLQILIKDKTYERPASPKIILFELLLVALRDGHITGVEFALLKAYQSHYQMDDFIFSDLLERAEALNQEVSKTIALVLE